MPLRNLTTLFLACIISLTCYARADRNRYAASIAQAMNLVTATYLEEVEYRELYEDAMRGMVEGLDPYSGYISPREFSHFQEALDQEFGGVGILVEIDPDTKRLMVMSPLLDTPAYRAGLKAGDTILAIDGQDTHGMSLREAVELMRGRPGDPVRLRLQHVGEDAPVEVLVTRAIIPVESVLGDHRRDNGSWGFRLEQDPRITYIRLINFGERTLDELKTTLRQNRAEAVVLDLRDNAGGLLTAAVDVCDLFIEGGTIVSTRGRGGATYQTFAAKSSTLLDRRVPIVVLINGFSASASEIVAACLQDHGRATVVGQRSWGKGTVQNVIKLEGGRAGLKLTTASYWRPSGKNIHRSSDASEEDDWGVRPDEGLEVVLTDEEADRVRRHRRQRDGFRYETPEGPKIEAAEKDELYDPQLEKAIEHLQQRLLGAGEQIAG
jgi:carboxyl-terminal processing protease